jgi:hypothetical protein
MRLAGARLGRADWTLLGSGRLVGDGLGGNDVSWSVSMSVCAWAGLEMLWSRAGPEL